MVEKGKQTYLAWTDADGRARICDAPLHRVDIAVGSDACGLVLVKKVEPTWPTTSKIFVTYENRSCGHFDFPTGCLVLLRTTDERGRPIPGARFLSSPATGGPASDVFGRLYRTITLNEILKGEVVKDGYLPALVLERCDPMGDGHLELKVVLRRP